jgi:hypothetical protein
MTLTSPAGLPHPAPSYRPQEAKGWSHDLETARRIQQHLFPQKLPRPDGWDVAAAFRPARVVAGDYPDLFWLGNDHLAVALGDVAGQGLGPALVMAGLRALVRSRLPHQACDLAGLLEEFNDDLLDSTPDDLFVTFPGGPGGPHGLVEVKDDSTGGFDLAQLDRALRIFDEVTSAPRPSLLRSYK